MAVNKASTSEADFKLLFETIPGPVIILLPDGWVALTGESTRFVNHSEPMGRSFDVYAFRVGEPDELRVALLFGTSRRTSGQRPRCKKASRDFAI